MGVVVMSDTELMTALQPTVGLHRRASTRPNSPMANDIKRLWQSGRAGSLERERLIKLTTVVSPQCGGGLSASADRHSSPRIRCQTGKINPCLVSGRDRP